MKNLYQALQQIVSPAYRSKIPTLTPGEITKLSWSRKITSWDEVPEIYRPEFRRLAESAGTLPYTVNVPTYGRFLRRDSGKLICILDGQIVLLESERYQARATCYDIKDISYLEVGGVLLQGWITIQGMSGGGSLSSSTIVFNRVSEPLFAPLVKEIRSSSEPETVTALEAERCKFNHLLEVNYKFMNFARRSLLPGEKVIHSLFQPEIRARVLRLFGRSFHRTISPTHLAILTDREFILIREQNPAAWRGKTSYGGIWSYIPLDKIRSLTAANREDGLLVLTIHLPGDDRIDTLFQEELKPEVYNFLKQFENQKRGKTLPGSY